MQTKLYNIIIRFTHATEPTSLCKYFNHTRKYGSVIFGVGFSIKYHNLIMLRCFTWPDLHCISIDMVTKIANTFILVISTSLYMKKYIKNDLPGINNYCYIHLLLMGLFQ